MSRLSPLPLAIRNSQRKRTWRIHLLVILLYTLLALLLTWPLITHIGSHVPGDGIDDPSLAWNLWWIKARLIDQGNIDIFHADLDVLPHYD